MSELSNRKQAAAIRVLIADDQELVRSGLAALLNLEEDIDVVALASDGDEVVSLVKQNQVEVALLDIQMKKQDGIETTKQLTESNPEVKVIIVTTFGRAGYLRNALQSGASGFLVKDTPAAELADAIRRVFSGQRVVDPQLAASSLAIGDSPLTTREAEVLKLTEQGFAVSEIASALFLSVGTVRNHLSAAIAKTGAKNRMQAARIALEKGWL